MEKIIKINAKSSEEALKKAIDNYNLEEKNVKIKEIEAPKSGFLGIFGSKDGVYEASIKIGGSLEKESIQDTDGLLAAGIDGGEDLKEAISDEEEVSYAKEFLEMILEKSGITADVDIEKEKNIIKAKITGGQASSLIGRRGETLDSIQFLTGLALNKIRKDSHSRVLVDIENYRSKREESLKRYANKVAREVAKNRKTKKLDYMNPYERRIVHSALQQDRFVITYSEGNDPYRRIVIEPKNKKY